MCSARQDEVLGAPSWEVRLLLERAAELEGLHRYEEALVLYHRGKQRAPLVAAFHQGIQRASRAVEAAIGTGRGGTTSRIHVSRTAIEMGIPA